MSGKTGIGWCAARRCAYSCDEPDRPALLRYQRGPWGTVLAILLAILANVLLYGIVGAVIWHLLKAVSHGL